MHRILIDLALAFLFTIFASPTDALAQQTRERVTLIDASAANPAVGSVAMGPAIAAVCVVEASANSHTVTLDVCVLASGEGLADCTWDEWRSGSGTATSADPLTIALPYQFSAIRLSVANVGLDTITARCQLYGY